MRKLIGLTIWGLLTSAVIACSSMDLSKENNESFVSVEGNQFYRDQKPYYFIGMNYWYGALIAAKSGDRPRLRRELDHMKRNGITNLRILVGVDGGNGSAVVKPALQTTQGEYNKDLLEGLDYLLAEMASRDMTAVLYLTNNWIWSGGMSQYLAWNTNQPVPNPFLPQHEWQEYMAYTSQFHSCESCKQAFRQHIRFIMSRVNSLNGVAYVDDPTIMSWQVANEPRVFFRHNQEAFKSWLHQTVELMKSLSPNQLISTGSEGEAGSVNSLALWEENHDHPAIDYLTMHIWPKNWSWYQPDDESGTLPLSIKKSLEYMARHTQVAERLDKPIVLEEFGFPRQGSSLAVSANTDNRNLYLEAILKQLVNSKQLGGAFAGINPWAYAGFGRGNPASDGTWQQGDDYLGDPAQEPQGLNSIFASDRETFELLKQHGQVISGN